MQSLAIGIDVNNYISNNQIKCFGGSEGKALKIKESLGRPLMRILLAQAGKQIETVT